MGNRQKSRKEIKGLRDDLARAYMELELEKRKHKTTADLLSRSTERVTVMEEELLPLLGINTRACPKCRILVGDDQRTDAGHDGRQPCYKCRACGGVYRSGRWAVAFREVLVETMKRVLADMLPPKGDTYRFRQEYSDPFPVPITASEIVRMENYAKGYGMSDKISAAMVQAAIERMKEFSKASERQYWEMRVDTEPMKVHFSKTEDPNKW